MEGFSTMDEVRPQLLDLIPNWPNEEKSSEEKQLELRLGPPGEDWTIKNGSIISTNNKNNSRERERDESPLLSLGYYSTSGSKRGFLDIIVADRKTVDQPDTWIDGSHTHKFSSSSDMNPQVVGAVPVLPSSTSSSPWSSSHYQQSLPPVMEKESLQQQQQEEEACGTTKVVEDLQNSEKKAFSPASAHNTAVSNRYQKRYTHLFLFFLFFFFGQKRGYSLYSLALLHMYLWSMLDKTALSLFFIIIIFFYYVSYAVFCSY